MALKLLAKHIPNMDSLVAVGTSASFIYGVVVLFILAYGFSYDNMQLIHHYSHELYFGQHGYPRTNCWASFLKLKPKVKLLRQLKDFIALVPENARVLRNDTEVEITIDEVRIDDIVIIRPGRQFPLAVK